MFPEPKGLLTGKDHFFVFSELGPGDKTLGFTEAFENILDESPCLRFYEDKSLKKLPRKKSFFKTIQMR